MIDRELLRARYATFAALALVFSIFLITELPLNPVIGAVAGCISAALLTAVLEFWLRLSLRRAGVGERLAQAEQRASQMGLRAQSLLRVQTRLLAARTEKEVLEMILQNGAEMLGARGASFVPFDEWGQSLPALFHGQVPESALREWSARLKAPLTRQACKNCQALHGGAGCVLMPIPALDVDSVRCFEIHAEGRRAGVVNYFLAVSDLQPESAQFVADFLSLAGKALDNLRLRDQEMEALRYLQKAGAPKADLPDLLCELLDNVKGSLDVDFALIYLPEGATPGLSGAPLTIARPEGGQMPDPAFLDGLWRSVLASGHSMSLENVTLNKREVWRALLAVPLIWRGEAPAGVLALGSNSTPAFGPRHLALLETLAGQAALLIQNARLMARVEYQAVLEERARLAREIHDGLAQTLAFLKIQAAQMQNYLSRGDTERLESALRASYRTLADAYMDARQSIDNLRRTPSTDLQDWVEQVALDFEQASGVLVDRAGFQLKQEYAPNVQAQLIRILQEALSNIRKHASATRVTLRGWQAGGFSHLEICDDGGGFSPEQMDVSSRYGLRGMRERADMIGADFQIISQPGRGTTVSLRLPAAVSREEA